MHTVVFGVREAFQNMVRNLGVSVASVTTSAMSLLVLGLFLVLSLNIGNLSRVLERQVGARVFLKNSCNAGCQAEVRQRLLALPGVASVTFLSKAEALANLERDFGSEGKLFAGLGAQNPLQNSYEVRARDPSEVGKVARAAQRLAGVASVAYQAEVVGRLVAFISVVRLVGLVVGLVLAFGALLVIYNAIRVGIYARRREIHIMRLVGATERFVRFPFLLEGVVLGLLGALLAFVCLRIGYGLFFADVRASLPFLPVLPPGAVVGEVSAVVFACGLVLGFFGSRLSLSRVRI